MGQKQEVFIGKRIENKIGNVGLAGATKQSLFRVRRNKGVSIEPGAGVLTRKLTASIWLFPVLS